MKRPVGNSVLLEKKLTTILNVTKLTQSIKVVYVEHYARWVYFLSLIRLITSDLLPKSDPLKINHLRLKNRNQLILIVIRYV